MVEVVWFGKVTERFGSAFDSAWLDSSRAKRHQVQGEDFEQSAREALGMASRSGQPHRLMKAAGRIHSAFEADAHARAGSLSDETAH